MQGQDDVETVFIFIPFVIILLQLICEGMLLELVLVDVLRREMICRDRMIQRLHVSLWTLNLKQREWTFRERSPWKRVRVQRTWTSLVGITHKPRCRNMVLLVRWCKTGVEWWCWCSYTIERVSVWHTYIYRSVETYSTLACIWCSHTRLVYQKWVYRLYTEPLGVCIFIFLYNGTL